MDEHDREELRIRIMEWVRTQSGSDPGKALHVGDLIHHLRSIVSSPEISQRDLSGILNNLEAFGFIRVERRLNVAGEVYIQPLGISGSAEMKIMRREFPEPKSSVTNVNNFYGNVSESQIQQGDSRLTQHASFSSARRESVLNFVSQAREILSSLPVDESAAARVGRSLDVIEDEANSPEPDIGIIRTLGRSVRVILEGAAGGALGTGLVQLPGLF